MKPRPVVSPSPSTGEGRGGGEAFHPVAARVPVPAIHPLPNPSPVKGEGLASMGVAP